MAWYLDTFFDRRDGGIEVVGGVHKRVIPCNWKFPAKISTGMRITWPGVICRPSRSVLARAAVCGLVLGVKWYIPAMAIA
jgi:hypothetical protein